MHLSSPHSTVNPGSLPQPFDPRARPENKRWQSGDGNISTLAIVFPPRADPPQELRIHSLAQNHLSYTCLYNPQANFEPFCS